MDWNDLFTLGFIGFSVIYLVLTRPKHVNVLEERARQRRTDPVWKDRGTL